MSKFLLISLAMAAIAIGAVSGGMDELRAKLSRRFPLVGSGHHVSTHHDRYGGSAASAAAAAASSAGALAGASAVAHGHGGHHSEHYAGHHAGHHGGHHAGHNLFGHRHHHAPHHNAYETAEASNAYAAAVASAEAAGEPEAPAPPTVDMSRYTSHNVAMNGGKFAPRYRFATGPVGHHHGVGSSGAVASAAAAAAGGSAAAAASASATGGAHLEHGHGHGHNHGHFHDHGHGHGHGHGHNHAHGHAHGHGHGLETGHDFHDGAMESSEYNVEYAPAPTTYSSASGTYVNNGDGHESSSYKRSTENIHNYEEGRADDNHYYNAKSYGKAEDDTSHEAFHDADEDIVHTPNLYRSKKKSVAYVSDKNKSLRESGSGVLAKDKHSSAFKKNMKKFTENVDQAHSKQGAGIVETSSSSTGQHFDDEDEMVYDSDSLGSFRGPDGRVHEAPVRRHHAGAAAAAAAAASGAGSGKVGSAGSVSTSAALGQGASASVASASGVHA